MEVWIECGRRFIEADVIRWTEAVFESRKTRRSKPVFLGEREVVAEVLAQADSRGFLLLLVRNCRVLSLSKNANAPTPPLLDNETQIRRQKKTLLRHSIERLKWDDEAARDLVASRFLKEADATPTKPPETKPASGAMRKRTSKRRT